MTKRIVITGTDTGIGKTVFSAGLAGFLNGFYWKPVQSGLDGETDSEVVARLAGLPPGRVLPEVYRLKEPLSPHRSAELDGVAIDVARLSLPDLPGPIVIEGAGGLMVPLNRRTKFIDIFAQWRVPVILCARTKLGTINHTLLSIEALRARSIPLVGIAFIGDEVADTQRTIVEFSGIRQLGRLPLLDPLTSETLREAMVAGFDLAAIAGGE
ncbi:dethiobiotin synthase [Mesorhizobium sp. SEMIA 3007]|uniref:ATP-dependent dethiobiotin synthetase BioD n=5 Tax=Mesorhizobium TaxID=68287 RepID=Q9EYU4_RHILI|nr:MULTISPECIES: dethiobiotin synthase [Mesorhizobium]AAG47793.1 BioD [Mesorhizobium japonicum R7A]MBZ9909514.1 dethiobiotin synthase [Mesorhizobium sp. BR115XR7A]ODA93102.1 dethiobiotin synthase [Mesorhizobium sp. SEMIA 3007]PDQ18013.1 ATP-dependent dethiobiotin synthetase BioD [Mesorhizobium sanjuanii]QGX80752.1 ATP-dependent dethiobiotin synthetase BioD [Mesorhizobium japonicum R7A]